MVRRAPFPHGVSEQREPGFSRHGFSAGRDGACARPPGGARRAPLHGAQPKSGAATQFRFFGQTLFSEFINVFDSSLTWFDENAR
jgi:hypothetical protein